VQFYRDAKGVTVHGGEISQAPPSVLDALGRGEDRRERPREGRHADEVSVPIGRVVGGCEQTTLTVLPYRPR